MSDEAAKPSLDALAAMVLLGEALSQSDRRRVASAVTRLARAVDEQTVPTEELSSPESPELHDWNQLFQAVTMGGLGDEMRKVANIPALWPNPWHQDCAMVAFAIRGMQERMRWLAEFLKACPHAVITHNDDADEETPVGYSITVESCSRMCVSAPTLEGLIDLAMKAEADEDGNVEASIPSPQASIPPDFGSRLGMGQSPTCVSPTGVCPSPRACDYEGQCRASQPQPHISQPKET